MPMETVITRFHSFEEFRDVEREGTPKGHAARQLMYMYRIVREIPRAVVLEFGTHRGQSATIFLQACTEADGSLVTVDVRDRSHISDSERIQFVRASSTDQKKILEAAPHLSEGIDVLYVDSLHTREHVEKEIMTWFPLIRQGGHIFFDDVDSNPYRKGNRKDDVEKEVNYDNIHEFVMSFFYSNEDSLFLRVLYGSTGLAHLKKTGPMGVAAKPAVSILHRRI